MPILIYRPPETLALTLNGEKGVVKWGFQAQTLSK
jgi:hypothetical protein